MADRYQAGASQTGGVERRHGLGRMGGPVGQGAGPGQGGARGNLGTALGQQAQDGVAGLVAGAVAGGKGVGQRGKGVAVGRVAVQKLGQTGCPAVRLGAVVGGGPVVGLGQAV